eukprot:PhF_6_TR22296/c0_g1_i1/m.31548/K10417/DYNC2LI; dynein light intermediate chain 2, cytosolic
MTEATTSATTAPALKLDPSKDLWTNIAANVKDVAQETPEFNIMILGPRKGGKTTVVQRYCNGGPGAANENASPTLPPAVPTKDSSSSRSATALEYIPFRREVTRSKDTSSTTAAAGGGGNSGNIVQQLHFWELGGGTDLAPLIDVVFTPEQIHTCSALLIADLSVPDRVFDTILQWLRRVDKRLQDCFTRMRAKNSSTPDKMISLFGKRHGWDTHPDAATVKLIPIPIIVCATKYDVLTSTEKDMEKIRLLVRSLRFLAHYHGASFLLAGDDREGISKLRALVAQEVLQSPAGGAGPMNPPSQPDATAGPVHVVSGADSFKDIHAAPPGLATPNNFVSSNDKEIDKWKIGVETAFPPKGGNTANSEASSDGQKMAQAAQDFAAVAYGQFAEPLIDACRRQKDDLQEQTRRAMAKKAAQTAAAQGDGAVVGPAK